MLIEYYCHILMMYLTAQTIFHGNGMYIQPLVAD
jgi:hypothetical protein